MHAIKFEWWWAPLDNVANKWVPEINHFISQLYVPYILAVCKKDQCAHQPTLEALATAGKRMASEGRARDIAQNVGADIYPECSTKMVEAVQAMSGGVARAALLKNNSKTKGGYQS